jgi:hypothetical protein
MGELQLITISCTAKLLKRSRLNPVNSGEPPTTALGDWHANLIYIRRTQLFLFVNDRSRLAVITPAKEARLLANHLMNGLSDLLTAMRIPQEWIQAEIAEMFDYRISTSRSRSVLGTMNDFKFQIENYTDLWSDNIMTALTLTLSKVPIGPSTYFFPDKTAFELLQKRYGPKAGVAEQAGSLF